jgi:uncharacterized protein (DUF433 family)
MTEAQVQFLPINIDPYILGGTPVFKGTRVPVRTVFDYPADGCRLDEFLDNFPTVGQTPAIKVLEVGASSILSAFTEAVNFSARGGVTAAVST